MFNTRVPSIHIGNSRWLAGWVLILALSITAFAPGMVNTSNLAISPADANKFVLATIDEPDTLDPALDYATGGGEVLQNVYETLVFYSGANASAFVPHLANTYGVSADGRTWTFHIRPGVTFHNNASLTASDVAYSFQRGLLQGGTRSPQWLLTEPFFGIGIDDISLLVDPSGGLYDNRAALLAADPQLRMDACQKVKAAIVADNAAGTVTMHLAQPWAPFLSTIAGPWGSILDEDWTRAKGGWDGSCNTWENWYAMGSGEDPLTAVANGTGPFRLHHWYPGQEILLTRNNSYWRAPAKLEGVFIQIVQDDNTRFSMLQAGTADEARPVGNLTLADQMVGENCVWNSTIARYACSVINAAKPLRRYTGRPATSQTHALMNFDIAIPQGGNPYIGSGQLDGSGIPTDFFSDVHIRKAFNYCFDWNTYGQAAFGGAFVQGTTLVLQGMPGYDLNAPHYTHNLAACAQELGLADVDHDGIPSASDTDDVTQVGFYFQIPYNEGNASRQSIAEILSANLSQVDANFAIEPVSLTWDNYLNSQGSRMLPIRTAGWLEDIHDPHNWYQPFLVGFYSRSMQVPDALRAQFQALIDQGVSATGFAARHAIYQQLNQLAYNDPPFILLGVATNHDFIQGRVSGRVLNQAFMGNYYYPMYKPLTALSVMAYDGWVLESAELSNLGGTINAAGTALVVGDDSLDRQYRSLLSFNTAALPDNAIITRVTLRLKSAGVAGTNPFTTHGNLLVDVRNSPFAGNPALQVQDFQALAAMNAVMTITNTPVSGWYSKGMASAYFGTINKGGVTQFRLRFGRDDNDDRAPDYIKFYSGNSPAVAYRPQLIIEYRMP